MTDQHHQITPPPELLGQWVTSWNSEDCCDFKTYIANCAAQWGSDQELEACCEWVAEHISSPEDAELRAARRPKPPSLKEQALEMLERVPTHDTEGQWYGLDLYLIRRALEALPND